MDNKKNMLPPNSILHGKAYQYRIIKDLGQGTFGITYLATTKFVVKGPLGNVETEINVAIKEFFMRDINGRSEMTVTSGSQGGIYDEYKKKFAREALNLSRLQHPNIIKVIESFEANNTIYYVMEYVNGGSLDDYIAKHNELKEDEAIKIVKQIGPALSYMHSQGMLHLDLKPQNIMRKNTGDVVLIDFGLSKQYDKNGKPESSTKVGAGTPGYAPIEQANYQDGKDFPVTMDVYALGATMFKMLTGRRAPDASEIFNDGFPFYELQEHKVSDDVSACIVKAMAPKKKDRYQTVAEFINSFDTENIKPAQVVYSSQSLNRPKRSAAIVRSEDVSEILIKYDKGYLVQYFSYYELTVTPEQMFLFIKPGNSIAKCRLSNELWDNLLKSISEDILKKEEVPYKQYEDSEEPPSFEIILYDKNKKKIDRLYVTGWEADRGNIENLTPYFLDEKIHGLLPSLYTMEQKLKSSLLDTWEKNGVLDAMGIKRTILSEDLSIPDTIHILKNDFGKGYGFSADIMTSSWEQKILVEVYSLVPGLEDTATTAEFPIDVDGFENRLRQYRFLENWHWEKDELDSGIVDENRKIVVNCDFIFSYSGTKTVYYSRTETSMGNGTLVKAIDNLLASEHQLNSFLAEFEAGKLAADEPMNHQNSLNSINEKSHETTQNNMYSVFVGDSESNNKLQFECVGLSAKGLRKVVIESCTGWLKTVNGFVMVVCDGSNSEPNKGCIASEVIKAVFDYFQEEMHSSPTDSILKAIEHARIDLVNRSKNENSDLKAAYAVALIHDNKIYWGTVGNCGIYYFTEDFGIRLNKEQAEGNMFSPQVQISKKGISPMENGILMICSARLASIITDYNIPHINWILMQKDQSLEDSMKKIASINDEGSNIAISAVRFTSVDG